MTTSRLFVLRFPLDEIPYWAERYCYTGDASLKEEIIPFMHRERYLSKPLLLKLAYWKSPRIVS